MKKLTSLNKYFIRHKWRLLLGILFVTISNLFAVIPPTLIRTVIDSVQREIYSYRLLENTSIKNAMESYVFAQVFWYGILLLLLAILRGVFMYLMRQTLIVMSRHIEYDQKKEIYNHYQALDTHFFKENKTGDLMNRLSEDVSRVRSFTGPAIMYTANLIVLTIMCVWGMLRVNPLLTISVIIPLPLLAIAIYLVNKIIFKKSTTIQVQLSQLTTTAQESFAGIRVIKSFVKETNYLNYFKENSASYRKSTINLAKTEAIYFPSLNLFVGLSMLSTILVGGYFVMNGIATMGNIAEFVIYINLMMFPMFIIGWVASVIQRAAASQQRIDEFLKRKPIINNIDNAIRKMPQGAIEFNHVSFTYQHTGIKALNNVNITLQPNDRLMIMGETGSGKSTVAQLLLRMYDPQQGCIKIGDFDIKDINLETLRKNISYAPQEALLFSDTIYNNIKFGKEDATDDEIKEIAKIVNLDEEINGFANGYDTIIGERGVMLSGGQKQRLVLARALLKNSPILILDECLSAVDTRTEKIILENINTQLKGKILIVISHRIFIGWNFNKIIVLKEGSVIEEGSHEELMMLNKRYAKHYHYQTDTSNIE